MTYDFNNWPKCVPAHIQNKLARWNLLPSVACHEKWLSSRWTRRISNSSSPEISKFSSPSWDQQRAIKNWGTGICVRNMLSWHVEIEELDPGCCHGNVMIFEFWTGTFFSVTFWTVQFSIGRQKRVPEKTPLFSNFLKYVMVINKKNCQELFFCGSFCDSGRKAFADLLSDVGQMNTDTVF